MTERMPSTIIEVLDVLACDITARPRSAPSFEDLSPSIRGVTREADAVVIAFDPARTQDVQALADAESQCCSTMRWSLDETPDATLLRVGGTATQLDVLASMLLLPG